jgi:ElaB/YqjD/DUF883 family membrane-anchored ribosome-binding protein
MEISNEAGNKLIETVKSIVHDAEKVLENSAAQGSEGYKMAKEKLEATLSDVRYALRDWEDIVVSKTKKAAVCTAEYVKENPWQAAGILCAVGVLIGVLIARK